MSEFLRCVNELGPELEATDLDEAAELLGKRPATWSDCDSELEAFVAGADASLDGELIRFFHRRMTRWQQLIAIGMQNRSYSAQPLD